MTNKDSERECTALKERLKKAEDALDCINQQDRTRGYPTGHEWQAIVKTVREVLILLGERPKISTGYKEAE